ncbi:MFS transporter [Planosporangium thailandense]|uniref:MFS transporter n=2 Tax=Planosporangium thailandense TaxID=765197 RepID=A0ABX0Y4A5_9ACTN|nr:MFS transporter [Planosporangium thailandense]
MFASGQIVSNTGIWVQRIAQDWLVLSITHSATAVGVTTALQFMPTLLFGLTGGLIADRYPKRRVLLATQVGMSSMAAALALLTLTHQEAAWHVYAIAFGLGTVTAVDNPVRQSFVNEMVGPDQLRNAISINSSVFQLAALIGPAISGALISAVGAGYAFAVNAASYVAPLTALLLMRDDELIRSPRGDTMSRQVSAGLRYVAGRPQLLWPIVLVGVFGMFTSNLPVTLAVYAKTVFQSGPGGYGLLNSVVALGSLGGALVSTRRTRARLRELVGTCLILATLEMLAAAAPDRWSYCLFLVAVGAATLLLYTSANSMVQLAADDSIRGRVMGVYLVVFIGGGALGGPLLGSIDQHFGPRIGMLLAGAVPAVATVLVALKLAHDGRLRVRLRRRGPLSHLVAIVHR